MPAKKFNDQHRRFFTERGNKWQNAKSIRIRPTISVGAFSRTTERFWPSRSNQMNTLLIYPEFPETYWSFSHALSFEGKRSAFPPLGLLTVSALLPYAWE